MTRLFSLFCLFFSIVSFSQNNFNSGYYIDKNNNKITGFIEDTNPYISPEKINFKSSLDGESVVILIESIKEFKIDSDYKFVNYNVDYDYDQVFISSEINTLGKEPNIKSKNILLKVLVEGKANLYKAIIDEKVFFYIKNNSDIKPRLLIHRKYNLDDVIQENNEFRRQLYDEMNSETMPFESFLKLDYDEKDLVKIFDKYNRLNNSLIDNKVNLDKYKNKFFYKIFAGTSAYSASYSILNQLKLSQTESSIFNPIIGFELSNILNLNRNRSEIFGRIFYQKVAAKTSYYENSNPNYTRNIALDFDINTINLSAGYRYGFYKTQKSKLFVDASLGLLKSLNSTIKLTEIVDFIPSSPNVDVNDSLTYSGADAKLFLNFGIGYSFNNRYSINFEYSRAQDYLNESAISGGISSFNVFFTYSLNK
jgi:hypothetical protein